MSDEVLYRFWICSKDDDGNYLDHQSVGRKVFRTAELVDSAFYDTVGTRDGQTVQFFELRIVNFDENVSGFESVSAFVKFLEEEFNQSVRVEKESVSVLNN